MARPGETLQLCGFSMCVCACVRACVCVSVRVRVCVCVCVCVVEGLGGWAAGEEHYQVNGLCLCARSWAQFSFTQAEEAKPRSDEN